MTSSRPSPSLLCAVTWRWCALSRSSTDGHFRRRPKSPPHRAPTLQRQHQTINRKRSRTGRRTALRYPRARNSNTKRKWNLPTAVTPLLQYRVSRCGMISLAPSLFHHLLAGLERCRLSRNQLHRGSSIAEKPMREEERVRSGCSRKKALSSGRRSI